MLVLSSMPKGRLEAFSDGVLAIIITIMVLELKAPSGFTLDALSPLFPDLATYALSFVLIAIYWNNHHHMLHAAKQVSGGVLWANMHLLFWLSLTPFVTQWLGKYPLEGGPVAAYGSVYLFAAVAYYILTLTLRRAHGPSSAFAEALGKDFKGKASLVIYAAAVGLAFRLPAASCALYVAVAAMWLVPDRRFERHATD